MPKAAFRGMGVINVWTGRRAKLTLLLIAGIAGAAGFAYANRTRLFSRGDLPPDSEESATYWYCRTCQSGFALSPRAYADQVRDVLESTQGESGKRLMRSRASVTCTTCGEPAVSAVRCPHDGTIHDQRPVDGGSGACPACGR